jgi:hypothetical protein
MNNTALHLKCQEQTVRWQLGNKTSTMSLKKFTELAQRWRRFVKFVEVKKYRQKITFSGGFLEGQKWLFKGQKMAFLVRNADRGVRK